MHSITKLRLATLSLSAMVLLGGAVAAQAYNFNDAPAQPAAPLPSEQQQMGIAYVTGGIGDEERMAMEEVSRSYNLRVTNVDAEGAFAGDTRVNLYNSKNVLLATIDSGPLLYVDVPAGKYTLIAINENNIEKRKVVRVSATKPSEVTIVW